MLSLIVGILSLCFVIILYILNDKVLTEMQKNQDILITKLELLELRISTIEPDNTNKQFDSCKQVEIHKYILSDETINKPIENIPIVECEAIKQFNSIIEPKKKKGNSRSQDSMREIIINIIADKKARMNRTEALFKKYHITKTTFYKYATEEQANELQELQKENKRVNMDKLRQRR